MAPILATPGIGQGAAPADRVQPGALRPDGAAPAAAPHAADPSARFGAVMDKVTVGEGQSTPRDVARADGSDDPIRQFEAVILTHLLERAFPKDGASLFGEGVGGDFYRSVLLGELGNQLAGSPASPLSGVFDAAADARPRNGDQPAE